MGDRKLHIPTGSTPDIPITSPYGAGIKNPKEMPPIFKPGPVDGLPKGFTGPIFGGYLTWKFYF
jgi:hypothetical protein